MCNITSEENPNQINRCEGQPCDSHSDCLLNLCYKKDANSNKTFCGAILYKDNLEIQVANLWQLSILVVLEIVVGAVFIYWMLRRKRAKIQMLINS